MPVRQFFWRLSPIFFWAAYTSEEYIVEPEIRKLIQGADWPRITKELAVYACHRVDITFGGKNDNLRGIVSQKDFWEDPMSKENQDKKYREAEEFVDHFIEFISDCSDLSDEELDT